MLIYPIFCIISSSGFSTLGFFLKLNSLKFPEKLKMERKRNHRGISALVVFVESITRNQQSGIESPYYTVYPDFM